MPIVRVALLVGLLAGPAVAGKNTDLPTVLVKPGKLIVEDGFERPELGRDYKVAKGEWTVSDGTLVGRELKADEHAAVIGFGPTYRDSIVRFSFQLKGTQGLHLSLNRKGGHLFRALVTEQGVTLRTDKDKKDPQSKPMPLGRANAKFAPGQWYTIQLEMQGSKVALTTDNGVKITAENESLDVDKLGFRVVTRGEHLLLDDVHVWTVAD